MHIACGDTKVVPAKMLDKIMLNTAGVGYFGEGSGRLCPARICSTGDTIIVTTVTSATMEYKFSRCVTVWDTRRACPAVLCFAKRNDADALGCVRRGRSLHVISLAAEWQPRLKAELADASVIRGFQ